MTECFANHDKHTVIRTWQRKQIRHKNTLFGGLKRIPPWVNALQIMISTLSLEHDKKPNKARRMHSLIPLMRDRGARLCDALFGGLKHIIQKHIICFNLAVLGGVDYGGWWIDIELDTSKIYLTICTNRRNKGWTSADRSTKATLTLTVPRSNLSRLQRI